MSATSHEELPPDGHGLWRGKGYPLGPIATRYSTSERSIVRVLRDQASTRADKPWLVFDGDEVLTFGAAWQAACRVADRLRHLGDSPHLAVLLRNQVEFMPSIIGAMLAGGCAVPLNADANGEPLRALIEHSDARVLVTSSEQLATLAALESLGAVEQVVVVDATSTAALKLVPVVHWDDWLSDTSPTPPSSLPTFEQPALVQYTSGTTSGPKGAVYPHHFFYLYSAIYADSWQRHQQDVLTTPLPLYHIAALAGVACVALHVGCTAHLKRRFAPRSFWNDAATDGATAAFLLGPMVAIIMKLVDDVPAHKVETVVTVPAFEPDEFERRFGARMLWQAYGMTEVCPLPARFDPLPDMPTTAIGHPVSWMDYGVVDEHDRSCPPGIVGEMVYRPRIPYGMITGYYKNAERTTEAFRNFMFHTGDLAWADEDGILHFAGRRQDRIRRRGENVSAADVEQTALGHEAVLEAAAYGVPSELGEDDIKLDAVPTSHVDAAQLHGWLSERLPRFMVPRYVEILDSFPKTPSERIQKFKLRGRGLERPQVFDAGDGARS